MSSPATLTELVSLHAQRRPASLALAYHERRISYAELDSQSLRMAARLQRENLCVGDRVAFLGRNPDLYFVMLCACSAIGAIFVPLNWRLASAELERVIQDCDPALTLFDGDFENSLNCDSIKGRRRQSFSIDPVSGAHDLESWIGDPGEVAPAAASPEGVLVLLYTSGTTGQAKGVQLTHRCLIAPREAEMELGEWMQWKMPEEKLLAAMPLFHIGCLSATMMAFYRGCAVVLMDAADPEQILHTIAEQRITRALLVPTLITLMLASPRIAEFDLSSLRQVMYGGSPIAPNTLERALAVFGCEFAQGYGMSECAGTCIFLAPADHDPKQPKRLLSIGKPGSVAEFSVRSEDGEVLPDGEVGEIWVRSIGLMKGYWRRPEEDRQQIREGWYRSGDAGYRDAEGYFYLTDRFKDMIVSGAENIYPAEIERELAAHPAILESAVIGIPHERWGEAVHAFVVLRSPAAASADDLLAFLRTRIAGFKLPRSLEFIPALPRNAFGKVVKYQLREPFWAGRSRRIAG